MNAAAVESDLVPVAGVVEGRINSNREPHRRIRLQAAHQNVVVFGMAELFTRDHEVGDLNDAA